MDSDYFTQTQNVTTFDSTVGMAGTVIRIHMKNFMCHDNLEVKLNPRINFIVGKNGSGKSAIQTAIAVGLGGKALATNRGANIKALIKNDKNSFSILIVLSNQGPMAYERDTYGDSIQIERTVNQSTSSYKIKDHHGQIISRDKKDLNKIVAHLNIQTDNPICILHQDVSRSFLNSSDPKMKYKFFMKASKLDDIIKLYADSFMRNQSAKEELQTKSEVIKEIFKDVIEMRSKLKLFKDAKEKELRKHELKDELVWASIVEKNNVLAELEKKKEAETLTMAKFEKKLREKDESAIREKLIELEDKIKVLDESVKDARDKLQPARDDLRKKTEEKNSLTGQCEEAKQSAARARNQYEHCLKELENLTRNAAEIKQRQEKKQMEMDRYQEEIKRLTSTEEIVSHEIQQFQDTIDNQRSTLQNKTQQSSELQRQLSRKTDQIKQLSDSSNSLSIYGDNIVAVVQEIDRAVQQKKFQKRPIGPIGKYIKVLDPKWAGAIENFLNKGFLTSFCVDNVRDANVLKDIFKKVYRGQHGSYPAIITSRFLDRIHNIKSSETGNQRYASLSKVLEFENPVVANCLIDQIEMETVLLIPTNNEAYQIMGEQHMVPRNCKKAFTLTGDLFIPAPNYKSYSSMKAVTRATLLHARQEDVIRDLRNEVAQINKELSNASREIDNFKKGMNETVTHLQNNEKELKTLRREKNKCIQKLAELREALETESSTNADFFAEEAKELQKKSEEKMKKYMELKAKREEVQESSKKAKQTYEELSSIISDSDREKAPIQGEIQRLKSTMREASDKAAILREKIKEFANVISKIDTEINDLTEDIHENTEAATQTCTQVDTQRSSAEIHTELKKIEQYLKKLEEENGGNFEELQKTYNERKVSFKAVKKDMDSFRELIQKCEQRLKERTLNRKRMQNSLAVSAKHSFEMFMSERHFDGKLEFDSENEKLEIKVKPQKEIFSSRHESKHIDTSSLSGGEKSFSTVCFILALWQDITLPFHFLDEFDVFMDMVNRRIVMDLLVLNARRFKQQFVFLTPITLSSIEVDDKITVHKLEPPRK